MIVVFYLILASLSTEHRYLRKIDCLKHISLQKMYFNKFTESGRNLLNQNEEGEPTRQVGWVNKCASFNCRYFCCGH
jgi:hypothetical protein